MKFSNLRIRNQFLVMSIAALLILAAGGGGFTYSARALIDSMESHSNSLQAIVHAQNLTKLLTDMESGMRGYVITREEEYLAPYFKATERFQGEYDQLRRLVEDDSNQTTTLNQFAVHVHVWRDSLAEAIEVTRRGGNVVQILRSGREQEQMERLRGELSYFIAAEQQKVDDRNHEIERLFRRTVLLTLLGTLGIIFMIVLLSRSLGHSISGPIERLAQAAGRIEAGHLEERVEIEQTNELGRLAHAFNEMGEAILSHIRQLSSIYHFSETVKQAATEREVYQTLLHALQTELELTQALVLLQQEAGYVEVVASLAPAPQPEGFPFVRDPLSCRVFRSGKEFLANNIATEMHCTSELGMPAAGSYYCVPLISGGNIIGAVQCHGPVDYWTEKRRELLAHYITITGAQVSNVRLLALARQRAIIDELTQLHNRSFLQEFLKKELAMARRQKRPLGVLMLDIDHFKSFNDTYGHEMGDTVLKTFADTVRSNLRDGNLVARYGGEEFVVVLPDTPLENCPLVAERLRNAIAQSKVETNDSINLSITASIGVAGFPQHGEHMDELIRTADKALYQAKQAGRNRVVVAAVPTQV